jgi:hypothetical protein
MVHLPRAKIFLDGLTFLCIPLFDSMLFAGSVQTPFRWVPCSQCFVFLWLSKLFAMSGPEEGYYWNVSWEQTLVYLLLCITCFLLVLHKRRYIILLVSLVIVVICTMIVFVFIHYIWLTISWYLYSQTY